MHNNSKKPGINPEDTYRGQTDRTLAYLYLIRYNSII